MDYEKYKEFANLDYKTFSEWLFSLDALEFTLLATIIGYSISPTLTINQQNSLGNFFELVGQIILTFNAQNSTLKSNKKRQPKISKGISEKNIYDEILKIKEEIMSIQSEYLDDSFKP